MPPAALCPPAFSSCEVRKGRLWLHQEDPPSPVPPSPCRERRQGSDWGPGAGLRDEPCHSTHVTAKARVPRQGTRGLMTPAYGASGQGSA